jgi:hypothetical protein
VPRENLEVKVTRVSSDQLELRVFRVQLEFVERLA